MYLKNQISSFYSRKSWAWTLTVQEETLTGGGVQPGFQTIPALLLEHPVLPPRCQHEPWVPKVPTGLSSTLLGELKHRQLESATKWKSDLRSSVSRKRIRVSVLSLIVASTDNRFDNTPEEFGIRWTHTGAHARTQSYYWVAALVRRPEFWFLHLLCKFEQDSEVRGA